VQVPGRYWPTALARQWEMQAAAFVRNFREEIEARRKAFRAAHAAGGVGGQVTLVELTPAAARKVREILSSQPGPAHLEVGVEEVSPGMYRHKLNLILNSSLTKQYLQYLNNRVPIAIHVDNAPLVTETTIDYYEGSAGAGFQFNSPLGI
jgi:Fe-S cluster assembly iron-binding protein IscA